MPTKKLGCQQNEHKMSKTVKRKVTKRVEEKTPKALSFSRIKWTTMEIACFPFIKRETKNNFPLRNCHFRWVRRIKRDFFWYKVSYSKRPHAAKLAQITHMQSRQNNVGLSRSLHISFDSDNNKNRKKLPRCAFQKLVPLFTWSGTTSLRNVIVDLVVLLACCLFKIFGGCLESEVFHNDWIHSGSLLDLNPFLFPIHQVINSYSASTSGSARWVASAKNDNKTGIVNGNERRKGMRLKGNWVVPLL